MKALIPLVIFLMSISTVVWRKPIARATYYFANEVLSKQQNGGIMSLGKLNRQLTAGSRD